MSNSEKAPYALEWQNTYSTFGSVNSANAGALDKINGDIYIAGHLGNNLLILKTNKNGDQIWSKMWSAKGSDLKNVPSGIIVDSHHNIYLIVNIFYRFWREAYHYASSYLLKYNSSGDLQFETPWPLLRMEYLDSSQYPYIPVDISIDSNDYIYLMGSLREESWRSGKLFIDKVNSENENQWSRKWEPASQIALPSDPLYVEQMGFVMATDSNGNSYIAGVIDFFYSTYTVGFKYLVKFDKMGHFQWIKIWGGKFGFYTIFYTTNVFQDMAIDSLNNIYLLECASLDKFDSQGNLIWGKYGVYGNIIVLDSKNNIFILGSSLKKYDSKGRLIWENEKVNGIFMDIDTDDNLYITGNSNNNIFISKYGIDSDGDGVSDWQEKNIYFTSPTSLFSNPLLFFLLIMIGGIIILFFSIKYNKRLRFGKKNFKHVNNNI